MFFLCHVANPPPSSVRKPEAFLGIALESTRMLGNLASVAKSCRSREASSESTAGPPGIVFRRNEELERKDRSELVAPRVRPRCRQASEKFAANRRGTRVDVACFLNEGDPLVEPVGQRSRVQIRTGEIVCT